MIRRHVPLILAALLLLLLPLLLFAPVALGSRTLLPVDALFLDQPYRAAALELGVGRPHNPLLADLILENYAWKRFLLDALRQRELPLWDPYVFSGHPFLANGQHSGLYPLSVIYYVFPLWRAFGIFTWLQLGLAGWWGYLLARTLGVRRLGALITGIIFQLSGFMLVSVVHPMIIAGASWLPFILAMAERVIRQRPALGGRPASLPWAVLGAIGLGIQMLAGHAENTYFVLLVTGAYVIWRLVMLLVRSRRAAWRERLAHLVRPTTWLTLMILLGLALGAAQFVPLFEVAEGSFRSGETAASLAQVLDWAYPPRRVIAFGIPNFFGSPAHHGHLDVFTGRWVPATVNAHGQPIINHAWGAYAGKNFVEGGAYLGLLPLFLALVAILYALRPSSGSSTGRSALARFFRRPYLPFFTLLSLFSLACIFGTPVYALIYILPSMNQSHSPFRWVFPLTLSVAVLAGFGVQAVGELAGRRATGDPVKETRPPSVVSRILSPVRRLLLLDTSATLVSILAAILFWSGVGTLLALGLSRAFFPSVGPFVERAFRGLAGAEWAFADHREFYSYEFVWVALFGLLLVASGIVLRVSRCPIFVRRRPVWEFLAVGIVVFDLVMFGVGFNPAVDPALLDHTPPVVTFLQQDTTPWRYATFTPPGTTKTMNPNVGMFYDLETVAGYDSIFSHRYARYMGLIEEQDELLYNRIASFSDWSSLDSPLTDLLNVKYVITEVEIPNPAKYELVYEDEAVRVYENLSFIPRAFTLPISATAVVDDFATGLRTYDPHQTVIVERAEGSSALSDLPAEPQPAPLQPASPTYLSINEVEVAVSVEERSWLVLGDAYFPGWKAFVRAPDGQEREVEIVPVDGTLRGVVLEPGEWVVRFKYSPNSVKMGLFVTFLAGMTLVFLVGIYLWRFFYREEEDASTVRRVAKNSAAPIVLNLFNQSIVFVFAMLMARIVGPEGNGQYETAVAIFGWFAVLANFGLDMYMIREVARDRSRARQLFLNATVLRLILFGVVFPAVLGFLAGWQVVGGGGLSPQTVWSTILLVLGLLPFTVANSLTALFRALEKHEYPAAIETVSTIVRFTLGALALVGGLGVVGVAGASVLTNSVTLVVLAVLARRIVVPLLPPAETQVEWPLQRGMLRDSWPLMLAVLLQVLFPTITILLLQSFQGDTVVGWYGAGRKWVDALNIIPQFFTMAVFPVMSHLAVEDRAGLQRSYRLSVKLLLLVALPVAILLTLLARPLVAFLSGPQFLPHGAVALRILIWSILLGWFNSLSNYVLIALDRQKFVLLASGARVAFALGANLLFLGAFSYPAAAGVIIGGEALLALLFYIDLRQQLGELEWGQSLGRPALAGGAMAVAVLLVSLVSRPLAFVLGPPVYVVALLLLRVFTPEEWELLAPLVPVRLRPFLERRKLLVRG